MPPIQYTEENEIGNIFTHINSKAKNSKQQTTINEQIKGPVLAYGDAPGEKDLISTGTYVRAGHNYPEDIEVPEQRYYNSYGLGRPFILKPPWSSITAYDLNTGAIKWKKPLGNDPHALAKGYKNDEGEMDTYIIDDNSGSGTQIWATDMNNDGKPDLITSNKKGTSIFIQK